MPRIRATTILAVRTSAGAAIGGDGQVTLGNIVMKNDAKKIRKLYDGKVSGRVRRCGRRCVFASGAVRDEAPRPPGFRAEGRDRTGEGVANRPDPAPARSDAHGAGPRSLLLLSGTGDVIAPRTTCWRSVGRPVCAGSGPGPDGTHDAEAGRGRAGRPGDRRRHVHLHEPQHRSGGTVNVIA